MRIHRILLPSCENLYTQRLSFTLQLWSPLELELSHHPINRVNFLPPSIWPQDLSRLLQTANSMGRCSSSDIQTTAYLHLPAHRSDEVPWFGLVAYVIYLRGFSLYCYLRIDIPALALLKELRITFWHPAVPALELYYFTSRLLQPVLRLMLILMLSTRLLFVLIPSQRLIPIRLIH